MKCPLCESSEYREADRDERRCFIRCVNCGLVFVSDGISNQDSLNGRLIEGLRLVAKLRENRPELPIIMVASPGDKNEQQAIDTVNRFCDSTDKFVNAACCPRPWER